MDFEFKHLVAFCTVVDKENFSRAAEDLGVAQASISERIASLEYIVGTRLLDRMGRRTLPTAAGRILEHKAREIIALRELLVQDMQDFLGVQKGTIRLGASTIPGEYILPTVMARLRADFPQIRSQLLVSNTGDILNMVKDGRIEAGFVGAQMPSPDLHFEPAWDDEIVLVLPPAHPWADGRSVPPCDLGKLPLVSRFENSGTQQVVNQHLIPELSKSDVQLDIVAVVSTSTAAKQAVLAGLGGAFISLRAIEAEVAGKLLCYVRLENMAIKRTFFVVRNNRRQSSRLFETLLKYTRE